MSFFVGSAARRAAPPFGISMLRAAEPPLRRGFACGKTLVRRTRAAGQKAGLVVLLQRSRPSKISILTVPSTKKASALQMSFLWVPPPISALRAAAERRLRAQRARVLAWSANACAVRRRGQLSVRTWPSGPGYPPGAGRRRRAGRGRPVP